MSAGADVHGVVGFGASAGGVEALSAVAAGLNPQLPYAYLMVLHLPARGPSILARIIDRSGPLPAVSAESAEALQPGCIYVCTPDSHLLVDDHHVTSSQGPTENGHRPAINALFRSIALEFGPRGVGVLLSGVLDDGVAGLAAIRSRGGIAIGQLPEDALFPTLPTKAHNAGVLNHQVAGRRYWRVCSAIWRSEISQISRITTWSEISPWKWRTASRRRRHSRPISALNSSVRRRATHARIATAPWCR